MTGLDLAIFLTGVIITLIFLLAFRNPGILMMIVMLLPLLIATFLVLPVPHYHNILQLIINILSYFNGRRRYLWKGWCIEDGDTK